MLAHQEELHRGWRCRLAVERPWPRGYLVCSTEGRGRWSLRPYERGGCHGRMRCCRSHHDPRRLEGCWMFDTLASPFLKVYCMYITHTHTHRHTHARTHTHHNGKTLIIHHSVQSTCSWDKWAAESRWTWYIHGGEVSSLYSSSPEGTHRGGGDSKPRGTMQGALPLGDGQVN